MTLNPLLHVLPL